MFLRCQGVFDKEYVSASDMRKSDLSGLWFSRTSGSSGRFACYDRSHVSDVGAQVFFQFALSVGVYLYRNRDLVFRKIFHLRQIAWKPSSVSITDAVITLTNLHAEPIFVASARFRRHSVDHLSQHLFAE